MNEVKPNVVVLLAGRWEVVDRRVPGGWTNISEPDLCRLREGAARGGLAARHRHRRAHGVPDRAVHRRGRAARRCPVARGQSGAPRCVTTSWCAEVAAEHPQTDSVVDLNAAACPGGKFASTVHGVVIRRSDGVHFTDAGGEALAPKLMPPIVAAGRAQAATAPAAGLAPQPAGDAGLWVHVLGRWCPDPGVCGLTFAWCRRRHTGPGATARGAPRRRSHPPRWWS